MAGQTTFSQDPAAAIEGMIADIAPRTVISRALGDAAGIGAGRVVKDGATIGEQCATLTASGQKMIGVTTLDLYREPRTPRYAQNDDIGVMKEGFIYMTCVDDMRAVTGPVNICVSGANAGLPQASSVGADLCPQITVDVGANTGLVGRFRVAF